MASSRREFLKQAGVIAAAGLGLANTAQAENADRRQNSWAMLTDLTLCIGCRKCEFACREANKLPNRPINAFEDQSVFQQTRRTDAGNLTAVNRYRSTEPDNRPVYVKRQCMHCLEPACASACPVAAIRRTVQGPVVYEASRCIGCRYCMMACPFSMPAYTWDQRAPVVRKCSMCFEAVKRSGNAPACARICPVEATTFGMRSQQLALARERIRRSPEKYVNSVYGEEEVGGTGWLYIGPRPFEQLGFRSDLGTKAYPEMTAGFMSIVPLVATIWPTVLLSAYALTKKRVALGGGHLVRHEDAQDARRATGGQDARPPTGA